MKNIIISLLLFTSLISCNEQKANKERAIKKENKVVFKIDQRTEFFRTVFNIAVQDDLDEDMQACETEYLSRVNKHFLPYKNHPLLQWINNNNNIGIDFSTIGLMYKNLENFEFDSIYTSELKSLGLTIKTLDSIKPLLVDFYQKTKFQNFFDNNTNYYKKAVSTIENQVLNEHLFDKVMHFYQEKQQGLELIVFVELTNNANNKAVVFYDHYNPKKRAIIMANICSMPNESNQSNEILVLNNDLRGVLYHEISHLFTTKLLNKYVGELAQYKALCKDCNDVQIKDKIDHLVVRPLQALMMKKFDQNDAGENFFLNQCEDVRKVIYQRLNKYNPDGKVSFEKIYKNCINLIKKSVFNRNK